MSSANSIKVVARFRPQNRVENESGGQPIVRFSGDDTCTIDVRLFPRILPRSPPVLVPILRAFRRPCCRHPVVGGSREGLRENETLT